MYHPDLSASEGFISQWMEVLPLPCPRSRPLPTTPPSDWPIRAVVHYPGRVPLPQLTMTLKSHLHFRAPTGLAEAPTEISQGSASSLAQSCFGPFFHRCWPQWPFQYSPGNFLQCNIHLGGSFWVTCLATWIYRWACRVQQKARLFRV